MFFENSPKRQAVLEEKIMETEQPNKKYLLNLCRTRWIRRHEAFENFSQLYEVVDLLEDIRSSHGWNQDKVTDAFTRFEFMMDFVVTWKTYTSKALKHQPLVEFY